jgi:single-strand DNA-binding protein
MAWGNSVTVVGNVTRDPELRFSNSGMAVARMGIAVNKRGRDQEEKTSFFDVVCFREMAENISESLQRGSRVIVTGELSYSTWETDQGDKRSKVEILADDIGPSMRWATAEVTKNERRDGGGDFNRGGASSGGAGNSGAGNSGAAPFNPNEEPF